MKTKTNHACPPTRRGSALLLTTILLFVVLSLVVSLSYVTVMEQQMSSKTKSSVGSFFNADSGVEWALNKIANISGDTAINNSTAFGEDPSDGITCPTGFGCTLYLLDENGKVIIDGTKTVDTIKAVRSVGTQTTGDPTQRAIEAAVAGTGGGCYTCYTGTAGSDCCNSAFKNTVISLGSWYVCGYSAPGDSWGYQTYPGEICFAHSDLTGAYQTGTAWVCCK